MGVWGTSIFSDGTASDVRGDYRDVVGNGLAGHEATDKILREYYSQEESEMRVVWLALAATQWNCGRLEERVKAKALEIMESGADLKRWTDKALERIRGRRARSFENSFYLLSLRQNEFRDHFGAVAIANSAN